MRLLSPSTGRKKSLPSGFAFAFTALVVAAVIVGAYLLYQGTSLSPFQEQAVQGRVVEGSNAMAEAASAPALGPGPTGFRVCNETSSTVGVALGYDGRRGWISEGWWNLPASRCETLRSGELVSRYYYVYAIDYDRGGEWKGRHYMCTHARIFTIRGFEDCAQRDLETTGFFEVDTAGQSSWTVQLTEDSLQQ
ncbi:MAG: DUF1036 domain-containing protein [Pseudomonadota bacterium]